MTQGCIRQEFLASLERDLADFRASATPGLSVKQIGYRVDSQQANLSSSDIAAGIGKGVLRLEFCKTRKQLALFRHGRKSQSVHSAERVGRRMKALVFVDSTGSSSLLGGFELSSSMFYLRDRDAHLGWSGLGKDERAMLLRQTADLSLYFSTPGFSPLRGSKLVALCALSEEVRSEFARRYGDQLDVVSSICVSGQHSPVLNRLVFGAIGFRKVGCTGNTSLSHLSRDTINAARSLCERGSDAYRDPNVRALNTVADALRKVGLPRREYIDVAPRRAIYLAKLPEGRSPSIVEIFEHWKERWMVK